jgi:hypothetical protein
VFLQANELLLRRITSPTQPYAIGQLVHKIAQQLINVSSD